jgi:hypothetical protein
MAYEKDQNDFPLPANDSQDTSSANFLPKFFRTDTNKKFLGSTIDQMIKPGVVEKLNSFAGRRYAQAATANDSYLSDISSEREAYQFEPAVLYKDELSNVKFIKDYNDYIGQLKNFSSTVDNHSILNSQEYYSWDPHIDWDKFVNFREYYWLPLGPEPIAIQGQQRNIVSTYNISLVDDGDNLAFIFSSSEFPSTPEVRNPTVRLFKGQTYRFIVNTPNHPVSVAVLRTFVDIIPTQDTEFINVSTLYKKGVTIFEYDADGKLVPSSSDYVENGVIEFEVPDDAPQTLYYISQSDVNTSGIFSIFEISENSEINIEKELLGKKTYRTSNGIELSNGMKVQFQGRVIPSEYETGYWYVEGVGSSITLINENDLEVPAIFTKNVEVPFDADNFGFDQYPFEDATSFPGTKDYIVIGKASLDKNPWARYNRWFHRSVIETSFLANGLPIVIDESARAKRPIIEFEAGLKLYNHGIRAKKNVTLVDTFTKDAFSTVEGSIGYNIDQVDIIDGMRVVFSADTDPLVNSKIFEVKFIIHNGKRQISLVETEDAESTEGDVILVLSGAENAGKMFFYDGAKWQKSQEKTKVNQFPLFDVFDKDGNSYADNIIYPANNFAGNPVFTYRVGTGTNDPELGFPLTYRNIANVGDIVFDFNLLNEVVVNTNSSKSTDTGFLKKYSTNGIDFVYVNGWKKAIDTSKQPVIRQYTATELQDSFAVDVFNNSGLLTDLVVRVYVNSEKKVQDVDYSIVNKNNVATVVFSSPLKENDIVLLKCFSSKEKNSKGFYEIPINLEKNPLNENISSFTLGQVNNHVNTIVDDHPEFSGTFPGTSNLRDLGNVTGYGKRFVQHSGPLNLAVYHITDKNANLVKALKFARREYSKFKRKFLLEAEKTGFFGNVKDYVDEIMHNVTREYKKSSPFYFSDMISFGAARKIEHLVSFDGPAIFSLSRPVDLKTLSNRSVNVYRNGTQLLHGRDYTFNENFVNVTFALVDGDVVDIYEYETTNGSFIPETPTKLGLFPKYEPMIVEDNTYTQTRRMIQGHDGSLTLAYDDYRDDILLELEYRIFNNIKVEYNPEVIDIKDFVGGAYRNTGFSKTVINRSMTSDFSQWLEIAGSPNFSDHNFWNKDEPFSYNYSRMTDRNGVKLSGYWRAVFKEYYDTDRPHTHPWEMLGFYIKPEWWESVYGPAPYTRDNLILWRDLADGIIREPGKIVRRNKKYVRPDLLSQIPVNEFGQLVSPLDSGLAQNFVLLETKNTFNFGDETPVETAWRRSSEYPFSLITAWVLLQPAKIIGLGFDYSRIKRDIAGNIIYSETEKRISLENLVFPTISTNDSNLALTCGFVNYIANYMSADTVVNYDQYKEQVTNLTNQLGIKLGGFADKSKLKLVLDSRSPLNKTSVFVPEENYQIILNTSSPLDTAILSGIIIEKIDNGFVVSGYDKENPVFKYYKPVETSFDPAITVGGISEQFVSWNENQQYVSGLVVEFNNEYYRVKITHVSDNSFDPLKFVKLAELPVVGGLTGFIRRRFENKLSELIYGSVLTDVQSVLDFMWGYEQYLVQQGFKFDFFNRDTEVLEDITLCVKEFMFWVTQNWENGTVITVSPAANKVFFERPFFMVDDIYDNFYDYNILTGSGSRLSRDFSNIFRNNSNQFTIQPVNSEEGIFLVKLPLVQKEHLVLIDNETVFNDVIYDKAPGYRQERIKIVGYRTDEWNGSLNIPGFIYDDAKTENWRVWTDYSIGDVVKYKEFFYSANVKHTSTDFFDANHWNRLDGRPESRMLPNWDYKASQISEFYDLETDNFDVEQERLAQHLIGYQKREYLSNIITDSVSQYKFYQGFIQEKGTINSLTKLFDALSSSDLDSLEFYEEWAIRLGQYGAIDNLVEIEYPLVEEKYRLEPQIVELVDSLSSTRTDLVYEIAPYQPVLKPVDYTHSPFEIVQENEIYSRDSGYVRDADITVAVEKLDGILSLTFDDIKVGDFVWVTNEGQDWKVLRLVRTTENFVTLNNEELRPFTTFADGKVINGFEIVLENYTDLKTGDIIGLSSAGGRLDGFYKIFEVELNIIRIASNLNLNDIIVGDSTSIAISKFVERRFADVDTVNRDISKLRDEFNDRVWIDNVKNNEWGVYENKNIFSLLEETINPTGEGDGFAVSFDANVSNTILAVGTVNLESNRNGVVRIYARGSDAFDKSLVQILAVNDTVSPDSKFGFDVSVTNDGKFIAVGAPFASNALTRFRGNLDPFQTYTAGDIVNDRGTLWEAVNDVPADGSTITTNNQDWKPAFLIETSSSLLANNSGLTNQGIVAIFERQIDTTYQLVHYIISPYPVSNEYFGYKVELRTTPENRVRLFVGAPGIDGVSQGRVYFLELTENGWQYSRDPRFKGLYSDIVKYNTDDIVYYSDGTVTAIYKARTNIVPGTETPGADALLWEQLNDDTIEYTGYIPRTGLSLENEVDSTLFVPSKNIGKVFDVNDLGDVLVLAARGEYEQLIETERVSVYKNLGRWQFSGYIDTDDSKEEFGYSVAINKTGDKIAIGAPRNDSKNIDVGCVYIYKQQTTNNVSEYVLHQTLYSLAREKNEVFGDGVDFYDNKLAVSGRNSDTVTYTTFDRHSDSFTSVIIRLDSGDPVFSKYVLDSNSPLSNKTTTFDGGHTTFVKKTPNSGRIHLFQEIGNYYIYAEDVDYQRNTRLNDVNNFKLIDNHIYIGLPNLNSKTDEELLESFNYRNTDDSSQGILVDLRAEKNSNSWKELTKQSSKVKIENIQRVFMYNNDESDILVTLDVIDPRQGKIPGPAEQEIAYKTFYDPAVYSYNSSNTENVVVDINSNWAEENVGKLWWNLSSASWYNPYQKDNQYRVSVWNKLIPGASIDVYEWVGSSLKPSQWAQQADTNQGIANGISGQPLYDDSIYSVKRVWDKISGNFVERYYYWVKSKKTIPANGIRRLSADQVERLIADPATQGYRFAAILGDKSFALYNVKNFVEGENTVLHFSITKDPELKTNIHREYQILTEGLGTSKLNPEIERKWSDSLIGYDFANKTVPDLSLPVRQRYGVLNFPRQGMFVNRFEALKQFIERANTVLKSIQVVDNYDLTRLQAIDVLPELSSGKYDVKIDSESELDFVGVAKVEQAVLVPVVENGKIVDVTIQNPGRGYRTAPVVSIEDSTGSNAIIKTIINPQGQIVDTYIRSPGKEYSQGTKLVVRKFSVLVQNDSLIGGRWAIYNWDRLTQTWSRTDNQSFDTTRFWNYVDWYAEGYNSLTTINHVVDQSYQLFALDATIGEIVRINNIGTGGWLLLEKINDVFTEDYTVNFKTVGRENGTIQLSERLYDYATVTTGYDASVFDNTFYDREPVVELRNILTVLKEDIFIADLETEYNKLFFASLRYVFAEQNNVDWAFKTSFVRAKHNLGNLVQKVNYQNDNLENYEDYVNEVKPYHTKVREYISSYNSTDSTGTLTTDFDLPPSYNTNKKVIETSAAFYDGTEVKNILDRYFEQPYLSWVENNSYEILRIDIVDPGAGYTQTPIVRINDENGTVLKAYLSKGAVSTVEIVNKGGKYYSAPEVVFEGSIAEGGRPARAVAIIGNSPVRKAHVTMKFDRVSGNYYITSLDETETFTGTGAVERFVLTWPMDIKTNTYTIKVNGIQQLVSQFTVGNITTPTATEFRTTDKTKGYVEFVEAPPVGSTVEISYKKDISMLNAADRINFFYNPTTGMAGRDLSQLMDGVEYTGSIYNGFGFGNEQGFGVGGFGALPWDTFDNTYEDEVFVLDGSTSIFQLSKPLELNVEYNVYKNGTRIDDPEFDGTTELSNPNAVMATIVGDGVTSTVELDNDAVPTTSGDIIVIRKSTSDGSLTPSLTSYDTALTGGNFSTANGLSSNDILVDGDGFVTPTTSKGPEELVPGQLVDTLDIQVFHKDSGGLGVIGVANYIADGINNSYTLPSTPQSKDAVIVRVNNVFVDPLLYTIDYLTSTVTTDVIYNAGDLVSVTCVGINGSDIVDSGVLTYDGSTSSIVTSATFNGQNSAFITTNGRVNREGVDYELVNSTEVDGIVNKVKIVFEPVNLAEGDFIQYVIYDTRVQTYSRVMVDRTFEADGLNNYHVFDGVENPVPFNSLPISHNTLVKVDNQVLSPGYSASFTATNTRTYQLEVWQLENPSLYSADDIVVIVNNVELDKNEFTYNPADGTVTLINDDTALPGSKVEIYVLKDAEYFTVDTEIVFDGVINLETNFSNDETLRLVSAEDSSEYTVSVVSAEGNRLVIRSRNQDLKNIAAINPNFVIDDSQGNTLAVSVVSINFILSNSITFVVPPSSGAIVEIYQFSNDEINEFERITYKVNRDFVITPISPEYVNRNLVLSGYIKLRGTISSANYAWVSVNGTLLTPGVDYFLVESQDAIQLRVVTSNNDVIDIIQFANTPTVQKFGYRIFKDMLNRTHYKRLNQNNSYKLALPLNYYDKRIVFDDVTRMFVPDKARNIPGVLFLDGERIEYFEISGNSVTQLRRGSLGTGVKNVYAAGTIAYGQGPNETIPYNDTIVSRSYIADGSTTLDLGYTPSSVDELEVFVGGRRLRKNSIQKFDPALAQDSPEGDQTVDSEFTLNDNVIQFNISRPNPLPLAGEKVQVVRKIGQIWNEPNKSLGDSNNVIGRFLRQATIQLPK